MAYFESKQIGRYSFGISVASLAESYDSTCPAHTVLPLQAAHSSYIHSSYIHSIYIFCVKGSSEWRSGSSGSKWKYYVLKSSSIPLAVQRLGYISYDGLLTLKPRQCRRKRLDKTILEVMAA